MATTSPDNLRTPNPTDPYNLVADLAILASDTQDAISRRGNAYRGTTAERTAFTTAEEGTLWVDTNGTKKVYQRQGTAWVVINPDPTSTSVDLSSSISTSYRNLCRGQRYGNVVVISFYSSSSQSGSFPNGGQVVGTLPTAWRPDYTVIGPVYFNGGYTGTSVLGTSGTITLYNPDSKTRSGARTSITFIKDS